MAPRATRRRGVRLPREAPALGERKRPRSHRHRLRVDDDADGAARAAHPPSITAPSRCAAAGSRGARGHSDRRRRRRRPARARALTRVAAAVATAVPAATAARGGAGRRRRRWWRRWRQRRRRRRRHRRQRRAAVANVRVGGHLRAVEGREEETVALIDDEREAGEQPVGFAPARRDSVAPHLAAPQSWKLPIDTRAPRRAHDEVGRSPTSMVSLLVVAARVYSAHAHSGRVRRRKPVSLLVLPRSLQRSRAARAGKKVAATLRCEERGARRHVCPCTMP